VIESFAHLSPSPVQRGVRHAGSPSQTPPGSAVCGVPQVESDLPGI
jgi:hypothetical protein